MHNVVLWLELCWNADELNMSLLEQYLILNTELDLGHSIFWYIQS